MSTCRMSRDNNPVNVEIELLCISNDPLQSASAILDRRRRQGNGSHAVLHVDDIPASLKIWKQVRKSTGTVAKNPASSVNVDQGWDQLFSRLVTPQVELQYIIVLHSVNDIRIDNVAVASDFAPPLGVRLLSWRGKRKELRQEQANQGCQIRRLSHHGFSDRARTEIRCRGGVSLIRMFDLCQYDHIYERFTVIRA